MDRVAYSYLHHQVDKGLVLELLRSEEHTSELQSRLHFVCRLLLEKKNRLRRSTSDAPLTQRHDPIYQLQVSAPPSAVRHAPLANHRRPRAPLRAAAL